MLFRSVMDPNRLVFVHPGESYSVGGEDVAERVEAGLHGHAGANGAKGSILTFAVSSRAVAYGHTHTIMIRSGSFNVGTFTYQVLPYTRDGISNWTNGVLLVGPRGERQLLSMHRDTWITPPDAPHLPPEEFFREGYPRLVPMNPYNHTPGVGDVDQWSRR